MTSASEERVETTPAKPPTSPGSAGFATGALGAPGATPARARGGVAGLAERAAERGRPAVRLDTSDHLTAAIALYRRAGYTEVAAYNDNPHADLWFERRL